MFKLIMSFLFKAVLLAGIFIAHIWVNNVLPYPFEHINLIFAFLFIYLLTDENAQALWYALILGLFLELFVSASFGVTMLSLYFCILSTSWLLTYFLTNRSFYIVTLAAAISMFIYRIYFLGLNSIFNFFFKRNFLYTSRTAADYAYEMALTALFVMLVYLLLSRIIKKLNPKYLGKYE
ncbi:MAG TPA: hypothetical protein P5230_00255 [Candidatus Magasanikbacteria bacterium]|nr:hypothetical protein [Candidatus Magasanikbacteria bacterium]